MPGLGIGFGVGLERPGGSSLLLDQLGLSAFIAISPRALRAAHAGAALRVKRATGGAETDIGFVGTNPDSSAYTDFEPAGNLLVKTAYDQSGNGLDLVQGTTAQMPKIVNSGSLVTVNGWPAMQYTGATGQGLTVNAGKDWDMTEATVIMVVRFGSGAGANARIFGGRNSANTFDYESLSAIYAYRPATNQQVASYNNASQSTKAITYDTLSIVTNLTTGGNTTIYVDGSAASPAANNNPSLTHFFTGDVYGGGSPITGYIVEVIVFQRALNSAQRTAAWNNIKAFWGTP